MIRKHLAIIAPQQRAIFRVSPSKKKLQESQTKKNPNNACHQVETGHLPSAASPRRMLPGDLLPHDFSALWRDAGSHSGLEEAKVTGPQSSTLWTAWLTQRALFCFGVCWPGDLDVVGLQLLRRDEIWGVAHEVVPPEGLGEGDDVPDAWRPGDETHQPV